MKRMLWWLIAGTKGGINRARIINTLDNRPFNANQLAQELNLDYKMVRHHIKVLEDNGIITSTGDKKYGAIYFLSNNMEDNFDLSGFIYQGFRGPGMDVPIFFLNVTQFVALSVLLWITME